MINIPTFMDAKNLQQYVNEEVMPMINKIEFSLAPILPKLEELNPKNEHGNRSYKHHQFLTDETGLPKLKQHLEAVHAIAVIANYDWDRFIRYLDKAYPRRYSQLYLDFDDE